MTTASTAHLKNLDIKSLVKRNYRKFDAFLHAMKVFQRSYYHYSTLGMELCNQYAHRYMLEMLKLYEITPLMIQNNPNWVHVVNEMVRNERVCIKAGVVKYVGRENVSSASVLINLGTIDDMLNSGVTYLDPSNEIQNFGLDCEKLECSYMTYLQQLVTNNQNIQITYEDNHLQQPRNQFPVFTLPYTEIHVEGFRDWVDFGNGIKLYIIVDISTVETNPDVLKLGSFQLHSIIYMLGKRLEHYRAQQRQPIHSHTPFARKNMKLSYTQSRVNPQTEEAFWRPPETMNIQWAARKDYRIKFIDMQIGLNLSDEFEDQFCICNEFCNLNAFFYYNPIYRFLMVRHNQLYVRSKTNVSILYLLGISYHLANQSTPQSFRTPLIRLLNSANNQWVKVWYRIRAEQEYRNNLTYSTPNYQLMLGQTYNLLRIQTQISDICINNDLHPFSDESIECISYFYKVLYELHVLVGHIVRFVIRAELENWMKEYQRFCQTHYNKYILFSFALSMSLGDLRNYDKLFTEDLEYSSLIPRNRDRREVEIRKNVTKASNPLNVRFRVNPFYNALNKMLRFIRKLESSLSKVEGSAGLFNIRRFGFDLENIIDANLKSLVYSEDLYVELAEDCPMDLLQMRTELMIFYFLKTYFIAFGIQRYFIHLALNYNMKTNGDPKQVFKEYSFIWDKDWIEEIPKTSIGRPWGQTFRSIFTYHKKSIVNVFDVFYKGIWGNADHELITNPSDDQIMTSVYQQYQRLYLWDINNGNNRRNFIEITSHFTHCLAVISHQTEGVYNHFLLHSSELIRNMCNDYHIEVIDLLVYWLVKSLGVNALSTIAHFLQCVDGLQKDELVTNYRQFLLCKPGLVPLFRTLRTVYEFIYIIKEQYIVFDDNFNRISKTLNQIRIMSREVFRDFFKFILKNWRKEILFIFDNDYPYCEELMLLHVVIGLSFTAAFVNDFRRQSIRVRKWIAKLYADPNLDVFTHQNFLRIAWDNCLIWLQDRYEVERAVPFTSPLWQQVCESIFTDFQQNADTMVPVLEMAHQRII